MTDFPTPRLLLEVCRKATWVPAKIYCDYKNVRALLRVLPRLSKEYKVPLDRMRVKNLRTHEDIAVAKLRIYRLELERQRDKRKKKA